MIKKALKVGVYCGLAGLIMSLLLVAWAFLPPKPTIAGESIQWLLDWLAFLGFPTNLLISQPPLRSLGPTPVVMVLAMIVNWGLIGFLIAAAIGFLKRVNVARSSLSGHSSDRA